MPLGRPIVSDCVGEFIDFHLNSLSTKHTCYIKDTYNFLGKVKNLKLNQGERLFSMNIESLYTNIETHKGLREVREWLKKYLEQNRPEAAILRLLELSLTKNDFEFGGPPWVSVSHQLMRTFIWLSGKSRYFRNEQSCLPAISDIWMTFGECGTIQKRTFGNLSTY